MEEKMNDEIQMEGVVEDIRRTTSMIRDFDNK